MSIPSTFSSYFLDKLSACAKLLCLETGGDYTTRRGDEGMSLADIAMFWFTVVSKRDNSTPRVLVEMIFSANVLMLKSYLDEERIYRHLIRI
jgi:hypothetical protein